MTAEEQLADIAQDMPKGYNETADLLEQGAGDSTYENSRLRELLAIAWSRGANWALEHAILTWKE